jgi:hypothetical protein
MQLSPSKFSRGLVVPIQRRSSRTWGTLFKSPTLGPSPRGQLAASTQIKPHVLLPFRILPNANSPAHTHTCCRANNILHGKSRSLCRAASTFHTLLLCFVEDIFFSLMVSEHWRIRNQRECGVRQISSLQARIFLIPEPFILVLIASSGIILD